MTEINDYTNQFLAISANVSSQLSNPATYVMLNWEIFKKLKGDFKLELSYLQQLVAVAEDNALDSQYHATFSILQAAKLLTIDQALKEADCNSQNYYTALNFYNGVPSYFCKIVGHGTCGLESDSLASFATLMDNCTVPTAMEATTDTDTVADAAVPDAVADVAALVDNSTASANETVALEVTGSVASNATDIAADVAVPDAVADVLVLDAVADVAVSDAVVDVAVSDAVADAVALVDNSTASANETVTLEVTGSVANNGPDIVADLS